MASKLITSFPANLAGGKLPTVQAVCVLFDGTNGRPLVVIDGTEITYWRTAADSTLGAKLLAPTEPQTLLVVGASEMSKWLSRAHRIVRPSLRRVLIWNRTPERAAEVASLLAQEGIAVEVTRDLEAASRAADIITTCTRSHEPMIKCANLKPGVHLDLVGSYTPETREADDEAVRRALIFADRRESAFCGVGDILQLKRRHRRDRCARRPLRFGRRHCSRSALITFFKNAGGGHLDLMTSEVVFEQLGTKLA
jgi:ornithine cyclodeaminase